MDDIDDILAELDPDNLLLEELEERRGLSVATSRAAEAMYDLQRHGALHRFVMQRRDAAKAALHDLIDADPKDAVAITKLQAVVQSYVDVWDHVMSVLSAGKNADAIIKENFEEDRADD